MCWNLIRASYFCWNCFVFLLVFLRIFVGIRSFSFVFLLELGVANTLFFGLLRLSIIEYSYNILIIKNNKAVNMLKTIVKHDRKRKREKERKKKPFPFPGASYFCWFSFITY